MEPLFIDTSTEYELDMSLFPGWQEDTRRNQPKLLMHGSGLCHCDRRPKNQTQICDQYTKKVVTGTIEYGIDTTCIKKKAHWDNTYVIHGTYSLEQDICDQIPTINDCPRTSNIGLDKCRSRQTEKRKHSIDVNDCERFSKRKCRDVSFSKNGRHFGLEIPRCSTDVCIPGLFSPPAQNYGFNMNTGKGRTIPRES